MKTLPLIAAAALAACAAPRRFEAAMQAGTLAGWHATPGGAWEWRGDVLVGTSPASEPRHGILVSDARFSDFEAQVEFRVLAGDSGFYFRVDETDRVVSVAGFQAEVDATLETGGLYETGGRAWVVKPDRARMAAVYRPGEWTSLRVRAVGGDVDVWVNDVPTASLRDDPGRREGHLGLQLHGGQDMHVEYRGLKVRDLSGGGR
ncbi:MAG: 3-keto-disaccharide hydrolase [Planctomycetota bacterium]